MSETERRNEEERHGARFWVALAVGGAVMLFGARGALMESAATKPGTFFVWIVGADLLHDLVVAPLVCAAGFLLARFLPEPFRTPIRSGLIVSALVILVGWPALMRYGRARVPDNLSVQPLDYGPALLSVITVVWAAVAIWILLRARSASHARE